MGPPGRAGAGRLSAPTDGGTPLARARLMGIVVAFRAYLLEERQFSEHTARAYVADLRAVIALALRLGQTDVDAWDLPLLQEAIALSRNRAGTQPACGRTVARKQSALRAFYLWHHRHRDAEVDPSERLVAPHQHHKLPRPVRVDLALAAAAPSEQPNLYEAQTAAAMMLLYGLGLRLSEASALADAQLDLAAGWAQVEGRGKMARRVPVPALCVPTLALWRSLRPWPQRPTFLLGRGGGPLACRTIARRVAELAACRLGRHIAPQQMRHSFATHLLDGGANLRQVQALLGHARIASTQTYTEVSVAKLRAAHAQAHPRARASAATEGPGPHGGGAEA